MIQCMPSPTHQCVADESIKEAIITSYPLPLALKSRLKISSNETHYRFSGRYADSEKTADASLLLSSAGHPITVKLVMEVGFSEIYEDLVEDAAMWIEGAGVTIVILVNFTEETCY